MLWRSTWRYNGLIRKKNTSNEETVVPSPSRTVVRCSCAGGESRRDHRTVSVCASTRAHAFYSGESSDRRLWFYPVYTRFQHIELSAFHSHSSLKVTFEREKDYTWGSVRWVICQSGMNREDGKAILKIELSALWIYADRCVHFTIWVCHCKMAEFLGSKKYACVVCFSYFGFLASKWVLPSLWTLNIVSISSPWRCHWWGILKLRKYRNGSSWWCPAVFKWRFKFCLAYIYF